VREQRRVLAAGGGQKWVQPPPGVVDVTRPGWAALRPPTGRLPEQVRGRDEIGSMLRGLARAPDGQVHVLVGLGGTGKSTVALSLADEAPQWGIPVWWVPAADAANVRASLLSLARECGASAVEVAEALAGGRGAADLLWRFLQNRRGWVLIFDNADDPSALAVDGAEAGSGAGWIRPSQAGLVVVTSRVSSQRVWGRHAELHTVGWLDAVTGGQVLADMAPGAGSTDDASMLSDRLGGLPLALHHAGSQLASDFTPEQTFKGYAQALNHRFGQMMGPETDDPRDIVTSTWELSLDALASSGYPQARDLLRVLSCLAPAVLIPARMLNLAVLGRACRNAGAGAADGLNALASVGLITASPGPGKTRPGWIVHPLVTQTSRLYLEDGDIARAGGVAVALLASAAPRRYDRVKSWSAWVQLVPHQRAVYEYLAGKLADTDLAALVRVTVSTARAFVWAGSYSASLVLAEYALGYSVRLGLIHPDVMSLRFRVASAQRYCGRYAEAEEGFRGVFADRQQVLGPEHPRTLDTRYEIGRVLLAQGKYQQAETEFRDLLTDRTRILGPSNQGTLAIRNQIARLLAAQGDFEQAETEFRDLLTDRTRVLGPSNPATLDTRYEATRVLAARGHYEQAEQQYRELLADRLRFQGRDHPHILSTRYGIADALLAQGESEQARQEFLDVLADRLRTLGPDHPSTLNARYGIARTLEAQGQYQEAGQQYQDVLAGRLRILGPDHPDTRLAKESSAALEKYLNNPLSS
jgi:tetratricopeptide (TPR) repeat protein